MAADDALDAMLDDALQDYERLEEAHQAPAQPAAEATRPVAAAVPPQQPLFPPSHEDVEATLNAVLSHLSQHHRPPSPPPSQQPQPQSHSAEAAAEIDAEADAAVERYIAALTEAGNAPAAATSADASDGDDGRNAAAVVQLLRPFVAKEMLYPPLAELRRLFPAWLEAQRGVLSDAELAQRHQQFSVLQRVCALYEAQKTPDDHIEEIVVLVERMGQAPQDLVAQASATAASAASGGSEDDGSGQQPELPPECSLM